MANVVIVFKDFIHKREVDVEVPLEITADEFISALDDVYHLGMRTECKTVRFLRMESPIALIRGENTLESLGMRMGSIVCYGGECEP